MKAFLLLAALCSIATVIPAADRPDAKSLSANDYLEGLVKNWNAVDFPAYKNHFTRENAQSFDPNLFATLRAEYCTWDRSQYLGSIEKKTGVTLHLWKVWFQKKPYPELFKLYVSPAGEITGLWLQEGS